MNITVTKVSADVGETVWRGQGTDEEGRTVIFAGDARSMAPLYEALRDEDCAEAWVEPWQVLQVLPADPELS